jgi:orotidine-5'-phosphate decarboxylase
MQYNPIIVALDVTSADAAKSLVTQLSGTVGAYKVGLELFNSAGLDIFRVLKEADPGAQIFYDAKFHDIPNTVAGAVRAAVANGIWMVNVHASGGRAMMAAAVQAASKADPKPLVIAVTILTSLDDSDLKNDLGVNRTAAAQVVALAKLAKDSGCDGVVCSPHEIEAIKQACGTEFMVITPGVRPAGAALGDQKRVLTPGEAVSRGADYIVVGRPITASESPAESARQILAEIQQSIAK